MDSIMLPLFSPMTFIVAQTSFFEPDNTCLDEGFHLTCPQRDGVAFQTLLISARSDRLAYAFQTWSRHIFFVAHQFSFKSKVISTCEKNCCNFNKISFNLQGNPKLLELSANFCNKLVNCVIQCFSHTTHLEVEWRLVKVSRRKILEK